VGLVVGQSAQTVRSNPSLQAADRKALTDGTAGRALRWLPEERRRKGPDHRPQLTAPLGHIPPLRRG
jgi:hypothetical protein